MKCVLTQTAPNCNRRATRDARRAGRVAVPPGRSEPVDDVVGPRLRLILVVEPLPRDDGAEDLLLHDLRLLVLHGHPGWLVVRTRAVDRLAAGQDLRSGFLC